MRSRSHALGTATPTELVSFLVRRWSAYQAAQAGGAGPFVLDGAQVSAHELSSPEILLPVVAWHADGIYRSATDGNGLQLRFACRSDTFLPYDVSFDRYRRSASELMLFVTEALEDARKNLPQPRPGCAELRALVDRCVGSLVAASSPRPSLMTHQPS